MHLVSLRKVGEKERETHEGIEAENHVISNLSGAFYAKNRPIMSW